MMEAILDPEDDHAVPIACVDMVFLVGLIGHLIDSLFSLTVNEPPSRSVFRDILNSPEARAVLDKAIGALFLAQREVLNALDKET